MTVYNTSSIFTTWRTLTRLLAAAAFPPSASNADPVAVWLGDYDQPPAAQALSNERVVVAPFILGPDDVWGPIGRGAREETYQAFVYVITAIPGQTVAQAVDRLEALTATVEAVIRTIAATAISGTAPAEFATYGTQARIAVSSLAPVVASSPDGAIGRAEIALRCEFRINTPTIP